MNAAGPQGLDDDPAMGEILDDLAADIWNGQVDLTLVTSAAQEYQKYFSQAITDAWTGIKEIGIDYGSPDLRRIAVMKANTFRFAAAKSKSLSNQLNEVARLSDTFPKFKKGVDELGLIYNKRHLLSEYNLAWAVGQNGAKHQRFLDESDVFPYVQYQTIGDSRVRDAHRALDGKYFEIGTTAYDIISPPNGWGCRCEMIQVTREDLGHRKALSRDQTVNLLDKTPAYGNKSEWDLMVAGDFHKNRGKIGEVFPEKDFPGNTKRTAGKVTKIEKAKKS